ncbi:hypothetical protein [Agrobacterium cavarae]|uniref:hypothetical protein n=1 Tax=Agrobacterium cavarae TaxID=2528239 RepID=UPI003FD5CFD9
MAGINTGLMSYGTAPSNPTLAVNGRGTTNISIRNICRQFLKGELIKRVSGR